jgi:hypothetical protein
MEKMPECFEPMLQAMYSKYVSAEARDIKFKYFRTLQNPLKSITLDHSSSILMLACYVNKLPSGTEPPFKDKQIKNASFNLLH